MIEEERFEVILKIEGINTKYFAEAVKLMIDPLVTVGEEDRERIIQAIAMIIRIKKKKKLKCEVAYWVNFLLTQFQFLNNRDKTKEISKESLTTDVYAEISKQEKVIRGKK